MEAAFANPTETPVSSDSLIAGLTSTVAAQAREIRLLKEKLHEDEKDNCHPLRLEYLRHYPEEIDKKFKIYGLLYNHVTRLIESSSEAPDTKLQDITLEGWRSMAFSLKRRLDQLQQLLGTSEVCDNTLHIESKDIPRHHPKLAYD